MFRSWLCAGGHGDVGGCGRCPAKIWPRGQAPNFLYHAHVAEDNALSIQPVTFPQAMRVWARIAMLSFGGPAGQIAVMHRILVEE
jgi:hypothetical protein